MKNYKNGCLNENTMIMMADGTSRRINELRIGDMIVRANGGITSVENIWRGYEEELAELKLSYGNQISLTKDHPVLKDGVVAIKAATVKVGDLLLTTDGSIEVVSTAIIKYESSVYNLSLSDLGSFFWGEGIAVGDMEIQNRLLI